MRRKETNYKKALKQSIFGQLFMLWTAPMDKPKLDITPMLERPQAGSNWFPTNLIIGHRP